MPKGIPKNGINKGWFEKGHISWNKNNGGYMMGEKNHFFRKKHTEKTKQKMRENHKGMTGKKHSEETKRKIGEANSIALKGKNLSKETKEKISKANKGKPSWIKGKKHNKETKKKISEALKGRQPKNSINWKGENHPRFKGWITKTRRYINFYQNQYKHRKRNAVGSHTFDEWEKLKAQYNWTCPVCDKKEPEIKLSEDHIIPLSKGGSNNIENIQPLCRNCNSRKYTKIINYAQKQK